MARGKNKGEPVAKNTENKPKTKKVEDKTKKPKSVKYG
jgi:hypothetical protein